MSDFTTLIQSPLSDGDGDDRAMVHFLVVLEGPATGQRVSLEESVDIGRAEECALTVEDPSVSGRHCRVARVGGVVVVKDLGSTNGTFIGGRRVESESALPVGMTVRIGGTAIRYECRSSEELEELSDLRRAARYVEALLPEPRTDDDVEVEWCFEPSAHIGGDGFGYHDYDDDHLLLYVIDVCGHGAGSALHAVSILTVLRQQSLPGTDFTSPDQVLSALNVRFGMSRHNGLFFTMWYGVWNRKRRELRYASAGHPPGVLRLAGGEVERLSTPSLALGMSSASQYATARVETPTDARLYLFTDGVFDLETREGTRWSADDFCELIEEGPTDDATEPDRLRLRVGEASVEECVDDFTLIVARFL